MVIESEHQAEFCARVKQARNDADLTQEEIAFQLGIERDKYKQYEKRSYLPYHQIEVFCSIVGCDMQWLMTGRPSSLQRLTPFQIRILKKLNEAPTKKMKALETFLDSLID